MESLHRFTKMFWEKNGDLSSGKKMETSGYVVQQEKEKTGKTKNPLNFARELCLSPKA